MHIEIDAQRLEKFEAAQLALGNHRVGPNGTTEACIMEWAAYLAGEPHSDHPQCVSEVIGEWLRRWNDALGEAERQRLKPYAVKVIGTATTPEAEVRRRWLIEDWTVHLYMPAWLDLGGMTGQAAALRALPEITGETWPVAETLVLKINDECYRAGLSAPAISASAAIDAISASAARAAVADLDAVAGCAARATIAALAVSAASSARASLTAKLGREPTYDEVYAAVMDEWTPKVEPIAASLELSAFHLLDRLIEVR